MSLISVIIVNFNGEKYLNKCFFSLMEGSFKDFEIILVDNCSSDGSLGLVKDKFPQINIIEMEENAGLAIASNAGAQAARGEFLFFLNNDTISDKDLLSCLVSTMESNPNIGICGCRTMSYDGKNELNKGVACDIFGYPYGRGKPLYADAGIFIRSKVFHEIGGFDSKLFLYGEDKDLCWRVLLYGYEIKIVEDAIFYHDSFCGIDSVGRLQSNIRKRFMGEAFTLRILLKNYQLITLLCILPFYIFINLAEMLFFAIKGRFDITINSYIRAYRWNLAHLRDTLSLRKKVQLERKIPDKEILKRMYWGSGKLKLLKDVGVPKVD